MYQFRNSSSSPSLFQNNLKTAKLLQSCPTLCDPTDGSPPGFPDPGILQARTLEWGCHFLLQCMKVKSESKESGKVDLKLNIQNTKIMVSGLIIS